MRWIVAVVGVLVAAQVAAADEAAPPPTPPAPPAVSDLAAPCATCAPCASTCCDPRCNPFPGCISVDGPIWMHGQEYVPTVPIHETRAAITVMVPPGTPFAGSLGEANTPCRGQVGISIARISDERVLSDASGNVYSSDGEVQVTTLEWVSPRLHLRLGGCCVPFHVGATFTGFSLHGAWYDGLRNFVEENLLNADPSVLAAHDIGGRELTVTTPAGDQTDLLGGWPMAKVKGWVKFPLPDLRLGCWSHLRTSLGVAVTTPAFGSHADSGNSAFQPEATFAWAMPLWNRLRWVGAADVAWAGSSDVYDRIGLPTEDVVFGARTAIEWWFGWRWALAFGVSWNSAYTHDSGLPTDLASTYVDIGLLYRINPCHDLHLTFSENPEGQINTAFGSNFSQSQKDADFTLTFGWRMSL